MQLGPRCSLVCSPSQQVQRMEVMTICGVLLGGLTRFTVCVWVIWSFSPGSPEVPSHLVFHETSSPPTFSIFGIAQASLNGGSPASRDHPHCLPTSTACHFELHPHPLTGQPRLPALTVSAWSLPPEGSSPSVSSPCPTLLYQG